MKKEEFLNQVTEIGKLDDVVQMRTKLTELSDSVSNVFDEMETDKTTITTLNSTIEQNKTDLEDLRKANMQLFLRVGEQKSPEKQKEDSTGIKDPESNKRKFEDLFKSE